MLESLTPTQERSFNRFWSALPEDIAAASDVREFRKAFGKTMAGETEHLFDFQASTRVLTKRYYFRFFWGEEKRSWDRLVRERQVNIIKILILFSVVTWFAVTALGAVIVVGLYLFKSYIGLDLMDGPSPLHGLFYG